jgi:cbb3-type cytochrome oxidase subunit 3
MKELFLFLIVSIISTYSLYRIAKKAIVEEINRSLNKISRWF